MRARFRRPATARAAGARGPWARYVPAGALALTLCAVSLGGCTLWQPAAGPQDAADAPVPATANAASLVDYAYWVYSLPAAQLDHPYYRVLAENSPIRPVRLAVMLSHPDAPFHDVELAKQLLDNYLQRPPSDTRCCRKFAAFLRATLDPRTSYERAHEKLSNLREEYGTLAQQVAELKARVAQERSKRTKLEAQIEALKAIEVNLNAAERPALGTVQ